MRRLTTLAAMTFSIVASVIVFAPSASAASLDIWWPLSGTMLSGNQPFKALVADRDPSSYQMFWQVDNGQWNMMADDARDYPHKEVTVDLSGWTWRGSGIYNVRFIATDLMGRPFLDKEISILVNQSGARMMPTPNSANTPTSTPTPTPTRIPARTLSQTPEATRTSHVPTPSFHPSLDMWWPQEGAIITGRQPFKGMLRDTPLSEYSLYWQVDNGQLNPMADNTKDWPHKESLVDLSGWTWRGNGPYRLNFIVHNSRGETIAEKVMTISVGSSQTRSSPSELISHEEPLITPLPVPTPTSLGTPLPIAIPSVQSPSTNPFAGTRLYVNPSNEISRITEEWRRTGRSGAAELEKIARQPETQWFGNWNQDVFRDARNSVTTIKQSGALPVFVAYNIPGRDCGGYSAGGSQGADAYYAWIRALAAGIGSEKAIVLLEPDALPGMDCLSGRDQETRLELLRDAVRVLNAQGNIAVYLDAGHAMWKSPEEMASRLTRAGISEAQGFSLNIANFITNEDSIRYGTAISSRIGGKHFVVETSRNGLGPAPDRVWCNPSGRALGNPPTTSTGNPLVDAYLWVKGPAGSDGACNGAPPAGVVWPEYAVELAKHADW